jgi:hypothetical protein
MKIRLITKSVIYHIRYKASVTQLSALYRKQRHHPMDDAIWLIGTVSNSINSKLYCLH